MQPVVANKLEFTAAVKLELKCSRICGAKIDVQETTCRFSPCGTRRRGDLRQCKVRRRQNVFVSGDLCKRDDMRLAARVPAAIIPRARLMHPSLVRDELTRDSPLRRLATSRRGRKVSI